MIDLNKCKVLGCEEIAVISYQNKPCCSKHYFFLRKLRSQQLKRANQIKRESSE